jgi:DNA-nicking Smr family endonuclease
MTPEDKELWKQVTEGTVPLVFRPVAAVIRPHARRAIMHAGQFRTTLDLHGYTIHQAHAESRAFIQTAATRDLKFVIIITGLSGGIKKEFIHWAELMPQVRKVEELNGGGAYKVYFKKRPK